MEDETGVKEPIGMQDSTEPIEVGNPRAAEGQRGPTWRGWVLSVLVAVLLSVTATLLLGGYGFFRSDRAGVSGAPGTGSNCCPPADPDGDGRNP